MRTDDDTNRRVKELVTGIKIEQHSKRFSALVEELNRLLNSEQIIGRPLNDCQQVVSKCIDRGDFSRWDAACRVLVTRQLCCGLLSEFQRLLFPRATPRRLDLSFDAGVRASSFLLGPRAVQDATGRKACSRPYQDVYAGAIKRLITRSPAVYPQLVLHLRLHERFVSN
jgi:hypothetical protein